MRCTSLECGASGECGAKFIRMANVHLAWEQFGCADDLGDQPPPWDWFFHAER